DIVAVVIIVVDIVAVVIVVGKAALVVFVVATVVVVDIVAVVDDYVNESAANTLRRSYSTDYLQEDGPRSRIRYMRIPGETIR
ncbi:unnamed protein product, partial [Rotaria sp. Silwood1]